MIRYRNADYEAHGHRLAEIDPVVDAVPLRHRILLARYATFAVEHLDLRGRACGSFLDVGARLGWLADFFRGSAIAYEGTEMNPAAREGARALGRLVNESPSADRYDVVFCRQAVQYARDVVAFVRELEDRVAPGGLLCIVQSVPWALDGRHHFNAAESIDDLLALVTLPIEHCQPIASIAPGETVLVGRRAA